jgi:hypothetical protein
MKIWLKNGRNNMKKYNEYLNEKLGYETIFGKKVSHDDALKEKIENIVIEIIREELSVSEKSFKQYDKIIEFVKNKFDEEYKNSSYVDMIKVANDYYNSGKRLEFAGEFIYDVYFKNEINKIL